MRNIEPDSEENQRMQRDNERAVFAAKMQHQQSEEDKKHQADWDAAPDEVKRL